VVAHGDASSCDLSIDGAVVCWGYNGDGELGNGTNKDSNTPVAVQGLSSGVQGISGAHGFTCALKTDGTVWCWGQGQAGQLGNGVLGASNVPVQVVGLPSSATHVWVGQTVGCAATSQGSLYCWGQNFFGLVGNGTQDDQLSAVPVGGLPRPVVQMSIGSQHTCAVDDVGALRCWGNNGHGELGSGFVGGSYVLSPQEVQGISRPVVSVAAGVDHTCAITDDGQLWCWGGNGNAQLGDTTLVDHDLPASLTYWSGKAEQVVAGDQFTCASNNFGLVYCWGANLGGQVGSGNQNQQNHPYANGVSANADGLSAGSTSTCAVSDINAVVCWGQIRGKTLLTPTAGPTFAAPGDVSSYTATATPGGATCTAAAFPWTCTITGLVDGQTYTFTVHATNSIGDGAESAPTAPLLIGTPPVPTLDGDQVVTGVGKAEIKWSAPTATGITISGYSLRWSADDGASWTAQTLSAAELNYVITADSGATLQVELACLGNGNQSGWSAPITVQLGTLVQSATVSAHEVRPLKDGFEDSTVLAVHSNAASTGTLTITDSHGKTVRTWPLSKNFTWAQKWTGTASHGKPLPYGTYHVSATMKWRTTTHVLQAGSIAIKSSAVDRPSVSTSAPTVFPVRDGYLDAVTIAIKASVPASGTLTILRGGHQVYAKPLAHAASWSIKWNAHSTNGAALAAGKYTVRVGIQGAQGAIQTSMKTIAVSSKRRVATFFDTTILPELVSHSTLSGSPKVQPDNTINYVGDPINGFPDASEFAVQEPSSDLPLTGFSISFCIKGTANTARPTMAFLDSTGHVVGRAWVALQSHGGCYASPDPIPAAAIFQGDVHVVFFNDDMYNPSVVNLTDIWLKGTKYALK
jgi:alpha-tubulin suppressor-like RCC1 family protein/flagellar hook assembly protein FlgD